MRRSFICTLVASVLAIAPPVQASVEDVVWKRHVSPDQRVSAEVPCANKVKADDVASSSAARSVKIRCAFHDISFVVVVKELPVEEVVENTTAFDLIAAVVASAETVDGEPKWVDIAGRRAIVNRERKEGAIAQTTLIELSESSVVLAVAGGDLTEDVDAATMEAMLDRFFGSLEISS